MISLSGSSLIKYSYYNDEEGLVCIYDLNMIICILEDGTVVDSENIDKQLPEDDATQFMDTLDVMW